MSTITNNKFTKFIIKKYVVILVGFEPTMLKFYELHATILIIAPIFSFQYKRRYSPQCIPIPSQDKKLYFMTKNCTDNGIRTRDSSVKGRRLNHLSMPAFLLCIVDSNHCYNIYIEYT